MQQLQMSSTNPIDLLHLPQNSDALPQSATQKTYVKKLRSDIERTKRFVEQAEKAILQLKEDQSKSDEAQEVSNIASKQHNIDTKKAHLLALYEVYKQLPYMASKNDLIGIATATTLTNKAVQEQARTSKAFKSENKSIEEEILVLETILFEYKEVKDHLETRIDNHPTKLANQRKAIQELKELDERLKSKIEQVNLASSSARKIEDALYGHVQRIVVKLHAMMDWENTNIADEETFRQNISRSATLIKSLVTSKASKTEPWVKVTSGTPEEHLAKLMVHHKILKLQTFDGDKVSL